jgi:hypothetical protein
MTVKILESSHHLTQREPDGELFCSRCGLYSPAEDESCVPIRYETAETLEKAA